VLGPGHPRNKGHGPWGFAWGDRDRSGAALDRRGSPGGVTHSQTEAGPRLLEPRLSAFAPSVSSTKRRLYTMNIDRKRVLSPDPPMRASGKTGLKE